MIWFEPLDVVGLHGFWYYRMLPRRVWHLCNLPCVDALFRRISIGRYVLTGQNRNFSVNVVVAYFCNQWYIVMPGLAVWLKLFASTQYVGSYHGYHICSPTFFFRHAIGAYHKLLMVCTLVMDQKCLVSFPATCINCYPMA